MNVYSLLDRCLANFYRAEFAKMENFVFYGSPIILIIIFSVCGTTKIEFSFHISYIYLTHLKKLLRFHVCFVRIFRNRAPFFATCHVKASDSF